MNTAPHDTAIRPLAGCRVLVPRGGPWGDHVAAQLRAAGAVPVIAPLINFAPASDREALEKALGELAEGAYAWLTVTSATAVDVLRAYGVTIPSQTRVAAVGVTTAEALEGAGYRVDLVPDIDNSAAAMAEKLIAIEPEPREILALRGEAAVPIAKQRLAEAGHHVYSVIAYRTVGVPVPARIIDDVQSGKINVILVTSGSVAEQVLAQFPVVPEQTLLVTVGPRTAAQAREVGLSVDRGAEQPRIGALHHAVAAVALPHATDEFAL